ncbi:MAG: hypothetical protein M0Q91_10110 [Methanoregula sp.]|jgi:hypothetical protein|nr:hypothetical protein [Methanoregula sp.]
MSDSDTRKQFFRVVNQLKEDLWRIEMAIGDSELSLRDYDHLVHVLAKTRDEINRQMDRWWSKQ